MLPELVRGFSGLVELFYPEHCAFCGAVRGGRPWLAAGPRVNGLRAWDQPHACGTCAQRLKGPPAVHGVIENLPVWGGKEVDADLVAVVGAWKYHGVRGLAWPLGLLITKAAVRVAESGGGPGVLVPVPLHARRERARGFNQAHLLAELLAAHTGWEICPGLLHRRRNNPQQARIADPRLRRINVAGAFLAGEVQPCGRGILLVDDLVTTGATALAAAASLAAAGFGILGVLCLGLARKNLETMPLDGR